MGEMAKNYQNNGASVSKLANLLIVDGPIVSDENVINIKLTKLYHQINVTLQKLAALFGNAARNLKLMRSNMVNPKNQLIKVKSQNKMSLSNLL